MISFDVLPSSAHLLKAPHHVLRGIGLNPGVRRDMTKIILTIYGFIVGGSL